MTTLKCIERKTGKEFGATRTTLENGKEGWLVKNTEGTVIKGIADSTFKKVYKLTGEVVIKAEQVKVIKAKAAKKTTVKVLLKTFTGMIIGSEPYEATFDGKEYIVETHKKGTQKFDSAFKQIGAKNPKFANKIELVIE